MSPFLAEAKAKGELQPSALNLCNGVVEAGLVAELGHGVTKETGRQEENARLLRQAEALLPSARSCGSPLPPLPPLPPKSPPALPSSIPADVYTMFREPGSEHRTVAPTFVPSLEVFDESVGLIQIASHAHDVRAREPEPGSPGVLQDPPVSPRLKRIKVLREKSSVVCSLNICLFGQMDLQQATTPGLPRMPRPSCPPRNYSSPRLIRGFESPRPKLFCCPASC